MKVRFRIPENRDPLRDNGITVPMAPAQRPRVQGWRWYALMLTLLGLVLWGVAHLLLRMLSLDGSGYISYSQLELRAPGNSRIDAVLVEEGQAIAAGEALLRLRPLDPGMTAPQVQAQAVQGLLRELMACERSILDSYHQLQNRSRLQLTSMGGGRPELCLTRLRQTLQVALGRSAADGAGNDTLPLAAPAGSQVERVWVLPGEFVAMNRPLLTLRLGNEPQVRVWMESRYLNRVQPGRSATVRLPDGARRRATVIRVGLSTEKVPIDLKGVLLTDSRSNLLVLLRLDEALARQEQVNNLPVEVRFTWLDEYPRLKSALLRAGFRV
jgi:multidrug resistance efflux pump